MTFYRDTSRPTGVNNLAFEDTAMPHVLWQLQGWQEPVYKEVTHRDGRISRVIDSLEVVTEVVGKPKPYQDETYEETVSDLVNFYGLPGGTHQTQTQDNRRLDNRLSSGVTGSRIPAQAGILARRTLNFK